MSDPTGMFWESVTGKDRTHSGERAVRVASKTAGTFTLFADIALKPNAQYKLEGWVEYQGAIGYVSLGEKIHRQKTQSLTRDNSWTELEVVFESGDKPAASVELVFAARGEAFFDDLKLVEVTSTSNEQLLTGDPKRGEAIFRAHPSAACVLCHALQGQGSNVGPALDGIAARKDAAYIKQSLLEPNAVLAQGFEYLKVSPMPPMGLLLTPQEQEDIQAFLQTLR